MHARILIRTGVLMCMWLMVATSVAQEPALSFEKFPNDNALSQSPITSIIQDHRGFIWLGTWSGLLQFDGYSIKYYRQQPDNANGLESNKITALFEDSKHRLWVGTQNSGLYRYDRARDVFVRYGRNPDDMNSLSNNNVWAIYEDSYGLFWIGTEGGLNFFNPETNKFIHLTRNPEDPRSISFDFVYSICEAPDGSLWIATEQGLNRLVRHDNHEPDYLIRYSLAPREATEGSDVFASHNYIYKVRPVQGESYALWAGTKEGLKKLRFSPLDYNQLDIEEFRYDAHNPESLSHNFVVDVWEDDQSRVWVATFAGLNLMNEDESGFTRFLTDESNPGLLNSNIIRALYQDRSNVLWVGTEGGLHKLDLAAKPFQTIRPGGQAITAIVNNTNQQDLWAGSRGGGLFNITFRDGRAEYTHVDYQTATARDVAGFISDIALDDRGQLWMTTLGAGLLQISEYDALHASRPSVSQHSISGHLDLVGEEHLMTVIHEDGVLWIGTWDDGIIRYDIATDQFEQFKTTEKFEASLLSFPIVHLGMTHDGQEATLWAGTRGNGLLRLKYDPHSKGLQMLGHYMTDNVVPGSLSSNFINFLFEDGSQRLWIGTENGLNLYDRRKNTFSHPGARHGLDRVIVQSMRDDAAGRVWVSTQQGILCISGDFITDDVTVQAFDAYDGLQDNYFNDNSACATASGFIAFGGARGMSVFDPARIHPDPVAPMVAITDFRLFNQSVEIGEEHSGAVILPQSLFETQKISLTHRDHVISFGFVGLQYREPRKIQYAYKLEGFDPEWVYTDASHRIAHYTNLPYSDFTFKVKAANGDGVWSEPTSLALSVSPPFWLTGWAYLLYLLALGGLVFLVYRIARMRANLQHSLQLAHLERENLEEVNKMKLNFFTNLSHELRTPLTLILSPLEQLLTEHESGKSRHSTYVMIRNNANRLLTMINQLLDFRKSEAGLVQMQVAPSDFIEFVSEIIASFKGLAMQRKVQLHCETSIDHLTVWYDHDWMEKVLFNLLSNALKFTPEGGEVFVKVASDDTTVRLEVRDTGIGIREEELERIFERFYQGARRTEGPYASGTGIGLALSKFVVDAHKGKIYAGNVPEGGAVITVELRLGEMHFTPDQKTLPQASEKPLVQEVPVQQESTVASPELVPEKEKPLILIVEDNAEIRSFLRQNLEDRYIIDEASDGKEGLTKALATPPDLVIADISMPEMDGIELCAALKSDILTSHVPVVILTARTSLTFRLGGLETGADDYITKPFNMQLVEARVRNLIESRRMLKEKFSKSIDLSPSNVVINSLDEEFIARIKEIIEKHIDDSEFTVEHLAKGMLMSRMQLYRKLKAITGKSPNKIIRGMRLKRAAQLLETLQYNVSDVTYMVGYSDLKSFREQFKKEFGVSPSEYEQRN